VFSRRTKSSLARRKLAFSDQADYKRHNRNERKDEKQYLGYFYGSGSDTAKTEYGRNKRDN